MPRKQTLKAIEEYAVECSIIKVWGSEMIDYVVDETVQIYGGLRICGGVSGGTGISRCSHQSHLRRHERNQSADHYRISVEARDERTVAADARHQETDGRSALRTIEGRRDRRSAGGRTETRGQAKRLGLFAAGAATQKYMQAIQEQQEIMGAIADMTIETYAMESAVLRAQKMVAARASPPRRCRLP